MVKPFIERSVRVGGAFATGARRPQTLPTQLREIGSGVIAGALYPFGWLDGGPGGRTHSSRPGTVDAKTPVLLVHGYLANKSNWYLVERELRSAGFGEIHAMNYSARGADIDKLAKICVLRAHEVMAATGVDRVHLVGHSLGGLVIRKAVQSFGLHEAASVITVATPHGGVDLARLGRLLGGSNAIGVQLRPGSDFLREMWADSTAMPDTEFVAYYSNLDLLVPGRRAMMLESTMSPTNLLLKDQGHLSIVLSRRLARSVTEQVAAIEGLPGYGRPVSALPAEKASQPVVHTPKRRIAR